MATRNALAGRAPTEPPGQCQDSSEPRGAQGVRCGGYQDSIRSPPMTDAAKALAHKIVDRWCECPWAGLEEAIAKALDARAAEVWLEAGQVVDNAWRTWLIEGPGTTPDALHAAILRALRARSAQTITIEDR